jgi:hypothetical protein
MTDAAPKEDGRSISLPARVVVSLRAGAVLAIANIVCVLIFSWAWVHVRADPKAITVTGSAKKALRSDLIVWTAKVSGTDEKLEAAYDTLKHSVDTTVAYLKSRQIAESQIKVGSIETHKHHERDAKGNELDKVSSYELTQPVEVSSGDVDRVADAARSVTELIKDGVLLESDAPRYLYTKLADLKITMLAEATKDATARAQQIASNSNATLGPVIDAKMGVMQINAIHSNDVSGSGVNDTTSLEKEISAVVTARFGLR